MAHHELDQPDYGTGQKKLGIYIVGVVGCVILTLLSFWAVMSSNFSRHQVFIIIFASACAQFLVQLFCFLRLNTQTEQAKTNVMSLIFTGVILTSIIVGSLWIMSNLNYYMMY
jgi:cytochrome o ubiquinol oxidase operon protein cyoD